MITAGMIYGVLGLGAAAAVAWASRRVRNLWLRWPLRGVAALTVLVASVVLAYALWLAAGDRSPRSLDLGHSVSYERVALDEPHRQVLHILDIDMANPCLGMVTTRPLSSDGTMLAETGTEFLERTDSLASINVAFFRQLTEYPFWDAYPRSGDPVRSIGPVVIDGVWLGDINSGGKLGLSWLDGTLAVGEIPAAADLAVRGRAVLIENGSVVAPESPAYARAVAGVDVDRNRLVLVVSDGKQPGYAVGSTYRQVAEFMADRGVDDAIEFDGGGSATMAAVVDGEVELLNRPSQQRIPGRQRPVASHLGITVDTDCG